MPESIDYEVCASVYGAAGGFYVWIMKAGKLCGGEWFLTENEAYSYVSRKEGEKMEEIKASNIIYEIADLAVEIEDVRLVQIVNKYKWLEEIDANNCLLNLEWGTSLYPTVIKELVSPSDEFMIYTDEDDQIVASCIASKEIEESVLCLYFNNVYKKVSGRENAAIESYELPQLWQKVCCAQVRRKKDGKLYFSFPSAEKILSQLDKIISIDNDNGIITIQKGCNIVDVTS